MSYRTAADSVILYTNAVNGLTIGNYQLAVTDPNMTFLPIDALWECVAITGTSTGTPTVSVGITGPNYTDIMGAANNTNVGVIRGIARSGALGSIPVIAPNSTIFCRVSAAGTGATVLTIRMLLIGVYY